MYVLGLVTLISLFLFFSFFCRLETVVAKKRDMKESNNTKVVEIRRIQLFWLQTPPTCIHSEKVVSSAPKARAGNFGRRRRAPRQIRLNPNFRVSNTRIRRKQLFFVKSVVLLSLWYGICILTGKKIGRKSVLPFYLT